MNKIPVFIINLPKDVERKAHMKLQCENFSLDCEFIDAVVGTNLSEEEIQKIYSAEQALELRGCELTKGEIGCALSHISVYQKIIDEALPYGIILEDDVEIKANLKTITENFQNFPADLELLLLGEYSCHISLEAQLSSFWQKKSIGNGYSTVRLTQKSYGAHGYLITNHGAKKLLKHTDKLFQPIDLYTGNERYINVYALRERIVMPDVIHSTQSNLEDARANALKNTMQFKQTDRLSIKLLKRVGLYNVLRSLYYRLKIPIKYKIEK